MIWGIACLLLLVLFFLVYVNLNGNAGGISNEVWNVRVENNSVILENRLNDNLSIDSVFFNKGNVVSYDVVSVDERLWGNGSRMNIIFDTDQKVVIDLYENNPFIYFHTYIVNGTDRRKFYDKYSCLSANLKYRHEDRLNTLGTGGLQPICESVGSYTYLMIANPENKDAILLSWLTQLNGIGTLSPRFDGEKMTVEADLEFGNFVVQPHSSRCTDTFIIGAFDDGRDGLELYGDYLAKIYDIELPPKPNVYSTWYHRDLSGSGASTESLLKSNANFIAKELAPFGLNVMQIDDHWQKVSYQDSIKNDVNHIKLGNGPIKTFAESNEHFPSGMKVMANTFYEKGLTAGIWFMPFSGDMNNSYFDKDIFVKDSVTGKPFVVKKWSGTCIDPTNPSGEKFLRKRFKRIYDWGYRYIKIDGLHTGSPSENVYIDRAYKGKPCYADAVLYNDTLTFVQSFRKGMDILIEEFPNTFITGCSTTQNMSSFASAFGKVHAMRVGPDNDSGTRGDFYGVTAGADFAGNLYFLNNKVWYNDPDAFYVRPQCPLHKAQWMASWQAVSGTLNSTSMQYENLPKERLDIIKRALPTHSYMARPIDILERKYPHVWKVSNDRINIIGLFNWNEKENTTIVCDFDDMSLDANKQYAVYDYWDNKYLGIFSGKLNYTLKPASCAVLAIHEYENHPFVLSTSRHITQGLIDVVSEKWNSNKKQLLVNTKVVADDDYELRLVIPQDYKIKSAECDGLALLVLREGDLVRIKYQSLQTKTATWTIHFDRL